MSHNQNLDSSKPDDDIYPGDPKPVGIFTDAGAIMPPPRTLDDIEIAHVMNLLDEHCQPTITLEDWSNPKLGVPVLLVRRAKISYLD